MSGTDGTARGEVVTQVIFDLNGTLADTQGSLVRTRLRLLHRLSRLVSVEPETLVLELRRFLDGNSFHPDIVESLPTTGAALAEPRTSAAAALREALLSEADAFRESIVADLTPHAGALAALRRLRSIGVDLHIWSGARSPFVRDFIRILGFDGLVDTAFCPARKPGIVSSLDGLELESTRVVELEPDAKKPDPALLLQIVAETASPAEATLLVGNNPMSDGGSTVGTGVRFVLSSWGTLDHATRTALEDLTKIGGAAAPTSSRSPWEAEPVIRLEASLAELFDHFAFAAARPRAAR